MKKQRGLSLIELMIALGLGVVVLLAVTVIFANTSRSRAEMEKSNRQTENGRYATQLLTNNLRMAGYLAEFDSTVLVPPAALPDPCATATADLITALPLHVQGVNDATVAPSCLSDLKTGTDILVVRRANSCAAGVAGCPAFVEGMPHFQASLCTPATGGTELAYPIASNSDYATHYFSLATSLVDFNKHKNNCTTAADTYRYHVHIYFIANNNQAGDGIPTLKRAELGAGAFAIMPLVEGIENMQIVYGIDDDGNGTPDNYLAGPASVAAWRNTMTARVHLLARNTEITAGQSDSRIYSLGLDTDGTEKTVGPFNDAYKRHVYTTTTRFANPAWRRQ
ncbi:MAG: PilW family protein [Rhodocyclaceae bacterium]|jgi:type IV pilus assembly protein PilW|nr:PilW family protein [Rhodocyclaceae bacterium]